MSIPSFPPDVPYDADERSFRIKHASDNAVAVMQTEDGPDIMRQQGNTALIEADWTSRPLTAAQAASLITFIRTTLLRGTQHFTMLVPIVPGTVVTRRCYIKGGEPAVQSQPLSGMTVFSFPLTIFANVAS